jgi:hypothetical protein
LTDAEIKELNELIEPSSKTEEAVYQNHQKKKRTEFIKRDDPAFKKKEIIEINIQQPPLYNHLLFYFIFSCDCPLL